MSLLFLKIYVTESAMGVCVLMFSPYPIFVVVEQSTLQPSTLPVTIIG